MSEPTVAAAQAISVRGEIGANVEHHALLAEVAASHGARWVGFPELSLTGYELDLAPALAFSAADERLKPLQEVAEATKTILAGVFVSPEGIHADSEWLAGYACEYSMLVAMANAGAGTSRLESAGGSSVWSPDGTRVAHFEGLGAGVEVARKTDAEWVGESFAL